MTVLKQTFSSGRPDDYRVVSSTSGKFLAVLLVGNTVNSVSVTSDLLDHLTGVGVVDKNAVSYGHKNLSAVYKILMIDDRTWLVAGCPDCICHV